MSPERRRDVIHLASRIAFLMVERHGAGAGDIARQHIETWTAEGDVDRAFCWRLIAVAIMALGEQQQAQLH